MASTIPAIILLAISGSIGLILPSRVHSLGLDERVQSEMVYLRDRAPLQTCWMSSPSSRTFSLNSYIFYFYQQQGDEPCPDELPADQAYYAFDRQIQSELAIRVIEDVIEWQASNPDMSFLSEISACESGPRSLGIGLISFPAITRASEIYVSFSIQCPDPIDFVRARIGFSYDHRITTLIAENEVIIWQ